jgi:hypothetical protein
MVDYTYIAKSRSTIIGEPLKSKQNIGSKRTEMGRSAFGCKRNLQVVEIER